MKKCRECGAVLNKSNLWESRKEQCNWICNSCSLKMQAEYRIKNKEAVLKREKKYREKNKVTIAERKRRWVESNRDKTRMWSKRWAKDNKDKKSKYKKKWYKNKKKTDSEYFTDQYLKHADRIKKYQKEYRSQNPDAVKKRRKLWEKRNKEERKLYLHLRRAIKNRLGGKFTKKEWHDLKLANDCRCASCGKGEREIKLTVDHIIPLVRWEEWAKENKPDYKWNDIENIQPLCLSCNSSKGGRLKD